MAAGCVQVFEIERVEQLAEPVFKTINLSLKQSKRLINSLRLRSKEQLFYHEHIGNQETMTLTACTDGKQESPK